MDLSKNHVVRTAPPAANAGRDDGAPPPLPVSMLPPLPAKALCGELEVDRTGRRAALAGRDLRLTAREHALLLCLVDRANRAVRRSEVIARVWEQENDGSNVIDVYIRRLRQKLGEHAGMIETVRGFGFRLRPLHIA
ncbi:MAG TPA: winged helix-turn-helix domain-containing protein [Polyangiaceae bacterium]|nr:winged helix-turn-helix domain-containing protein [Polyangiaceae bacterium]